MPRPASQFIVTAGARLCQCGAPAAVLGEHRSYPRAVDAASAHWVLYVNLWGEHTYWIDIQVVDTRDGTILWQNGQPTERGRQEHGKEAGTAGSARGDRQHAGGWIIEQWRERQWRGDPG